MGEPPGAMWMGMGPARPKLAENGYFAGNSGRFGIMGPVKCRVCGVAEWNHLCGPVALSKLAGAKPKPVTARVTKIEPAVPRVPIMPLNNGTPEKKWRGRPKAAGTKAERQAAYRARKKVAP